MTTLLPTFSQLRASTPSVRLVTIGASEIDDYAAGAAQDRAIVVRIVRGRRCVEKEQLLQEFAAAMQFPEYFGENWDAFEECITDLSWLGTSEVLVVVTDAKHLLEHHPKDLSTFAGIVTASLGDQTSPLRHLFIQCSPSDEESLRKRLHAAGLAV